MVPLPNGFESLEPVVQLFSSLRVPWWLTGGWAIDLATGYVSRPHNGIDLYMLSEDASALARQMDGATFEAGNPPPVSSADGVGPRVHGRLFVASPTLSLRTQIAFGCREADDWVLPEDPAIRLPIAEAFTSTSAVPRLALQVILLLRAFSFRPQDQADFETALPLLDKRARAWLARAIEARSHAVTPDHRTDGHPWFAALEGD